MSKTIHIHIGGKTKDAGSREVDTANTYLKQINAYRCFILKNDDLHEAEEAENDLDSLEKLIANARQALKKVG